MNYQTTHEEVRALRSDRERIADLLSRYPRLSHHETGEIVTFLRTGRHLDIGMLTSSERLRPQARRVHGRSSKPFPGEVG